MHEHIKKNTKKEKGRQTWMEGIQQKRNRKEKRKRKKIEVKEKKKILCDKKGNKQRNKSKQTNRKRGRKM